jgi:DNA-damage-inducible protein J
MSTAMSPVSAKVPQEEKKRFYEATRLNGTTPANAIRMFIAAFNDAGTFPYDVRMMAHEPNEETIAAMDELKRGEGSGSFSTVEELFAELES